MTFTYLIFYFNIPQLFLRNFKLSILSNYAEHFKELAPFVIRTTHFYIIHGFSDGFFNFSQLKRQ